ncbi:hypothetical protein Hanom_Chr16g01437441 [Helianthus anomalus]
MSEDRMAILTVSRKRMSEEVTLSWKEHKLTMWVEEIAGQWCPDFLEKRKMNDERCLRCSVRSRQSCPARLVPQKS